MQTSDTTEAASLVNDWLQLYKIDVLYVIGPFAIEYPYVDKYVTIIVEGALLLDVMDAPTGSDITDFSSDEYLRFSIFIALNYVIL